MATRYEIVNPSDWMLQIVELMVMNWEETGFDWEFKPSLAMYQKLWDLGIMFAVAAIEDDQVIGYVTVSVYPHLFNPDLKFASQDAMFVHPDHRKGLVSGRLIKLAEQEAEDRGAHKFIWHTRAGTPFAGMLKKRGYEEADICVMRDL